MLVLDVVQHKVEGWGLFTEVSDNDDGSADSLLDGAISIELSETNPLAEGLSVIGQDERDAAFSAEGLDKLGVLIIVTGL